VVGRTGAFRVFTIVALPTMRPRSLCTEARRTALTRARQQADTLGILAGTVPATGPGIRATVTDPVAYTRPWTIEMPLYRIVDADAQLLEHKCVPFADQLLYKDLLETNRK